MSGYGIDRLLADPRRYLSGRKVALLANQASLTGSGSPTTEALRLDPNIELSVILTAEHGVSGYEDDATPIPDRRDPRTGIPLRSLYGPRRRPPAELLKSVDAVVIDVQEIGVRCYTYAATAALVCEAAAETGTRVLLCDRPNPLGDRVDGPPLDPAHSSFLGYLDVPYQHGATIGQVVKWGVRDLDVDLTVIPAIRGFQLPYFVPPSPGLPTRESVLLYPGLVLLEGVNLNEGRGTTLPFQLIGAPWLEGYALAEELNALCLPGLHFRPVTYLPKSDEHAGELCHGVQLHITSEAELRPLASVMAVLEQIRKTHPDEFKWVRAADKPWSTLLGAGEVWHEPVTGDLIDGLTGGTEVRRVIEGELQLSEVQGRWREAAAAWEGELKTL